MSGPVVVAFGGGVDSTAMLCELVARSEPFDAVVFADTGSEMPETYENLVRVSQWLLRERRLEIVVVRQKSKTGESLSLEEFCHKYKTLPSIAYGFKSCSLKMKARPSDVWCAAWPLAIEAWQSGAKVTKLIGYDADEERRAQIRTDKKYDYRYPLIEWGYERTDAIAAIRRAGLPVPPKSSCFFCPSRTVPEIHQLAAEHPALFIRALELEAQAELTTIHGLGRRFAWASLAGVRPGQSNLFPAAVEISCGCGT